MLEQKPFGLYVHIPFCKRKCGYCDFYSLKGLDEAPAYMATLRREMEALTATLPSRAADTFYVGGGTPSYLPDHHLATLVEDVHRLFDLTPCEERTLECNPGAFNADKARLIRDLGFNRVSLGAQSFVERDLKFLNRIHTPDQIFRSVDHLRSAGISNINLDLIFGIPGQTRQEFEANLRAALSLEPTHLSVYGLTIEEGTPLYDRFLAGEFAKVHDEMYEAMFLTAHAFLERMGFAHYEISNYARPGFESRHNLNCWRHRDYYGFGVSAHSRVGIKRWANATDLDAYLAWPFKRKFLNHLTDGQARLERLMLSLRLSEGIVRNRNLSPIIDRLKARRLLRESADRVSLTAEGMLVIDEIILLLEDQECLTLN